MIQKADMALLNRLIVSDASFLTLREKLLFYQYLSDSTSSLPCTDFEAFVNSLTLDSLSLCVKRVFQKAKWNGRSALAKVKASYTILNKMGIKWTCYDSFDYPAMLREMKDPPFMLFYRGRLEILRKKCVSVVGTRRAGVKALNAASDFAKEACNNDFCVISGLAFGIDSAAHKGALLSEKSATAAILPSGIDIITPSSHIRLAVKILEKGGLIMSEYLPGTPSVQFRYVKRNRIVAALSPATVIIQAPAGSGAMLTAGLALDYNREVFFHKECFSPEAGALNKVCIENLKEKNSKGKRTEAKMNNTAEAFVNDGARIVSDFNGFYKLMYPKCRVS